jgi:hypothetical protein
MKKKNVPDIPKSPTRKLLFSFSLVVMTATAFGQQFKSIKSAEGIELQENGKKILFYQVRPKTVDGKFERAGYIHPLYSLHGNSLTDDMPKDHPYHRGIFWAWHQFILNDSSIGDGWVSQKISYYPVKVEVRKYKSSAVIQSNMVWKAELPNNKIVDIVKENTSITVYPTTDHYRIIDFDIRLNALVNNLKIGGSDDEKGYGGFCLRLKLPADISFVSQGKSITPTETAVAAGPWMDITGSIEGPGQKSGVIVFANSTGVDQQPWILRSVTSMQNVPFPGRNAVPLTKEGLRLKYRVIIHDDQLTSAEIDKLYQQYVQEKKG